MNAYAQFRAQKDEFFELDRHSPLTPEQKNAFDGLNYFEINEDLVFRLGIEKFQEQKTVMMQTSTGDVNSYLKFGRVHFEVAGEVLSLTVFSSEHGFFLPFIDATAGKETYGAGRYLDPVLNEKGELIVDFNFAYNPYCAYNDLYSCPIPPAENRLSEAIKAGEKNYK